MTSTKRVTILSAIAIFIMLTVAATWPYSVEAAPKTRICAINPMLCPEVID